MHSFYLPSAVGIRARVSLLTKDSSVTVVRRHRRLETPNSATGEHAERAPVYIERSGDGAGKASYPRVPLWP
jgi:hypothetical protein